MSTSSETGYGTIAVRVQPEQVRIDLLDGSLQRVASSFGELRQRVKAGLYMLVFDAGVSSQHKSLHVSGGQEVDLGTVEVPFPCAAPIPGTLGFHPEHAQAARALSHAPTSRPGQGGR